MTVSLPALAYRLGVLEPYHTVAAPSGHHHAGYVSKTRALIQGTPLDSASLEDSVCSSAECDRTLFNAAAQAWTRSFYWRSITPGGGGPGQIAQLIECFGQQDFNWQFVATQAIC